MKQRMTEIWYSGDNKRHYYVRHGGGAEHVGSPDELTDRVTGFVLALFERLKEYEDIFYDRTKKPLLDLKRMKTLVEADAAGRLFLLPANVGDTVYVVARCDEIRKNNVPNIFDGCEDIVCPYSNTDDECPETYCNGSRTEYRVFKDKVVGFSLDPEYDKSVLIHLENLNDPVRIEDFDGKIFRNELDAMLTIY